MTPDSNFSEVSRTSLSDAIVQRFREMIERGDLLPGQKLPPMRELADQFGVGISSIREAVTALTALGIVQSHVGDGTYIRSNLPESILAPLSWSFILMQGKLDELIEARRLVEVHLAGLAAERAAEDDIEEMEGIAESFRKAIGDKARCLELDLSFHLSVAKAARNIILKDFLVRLRHLLDPLVGQFLSDEAGQLLSSEGHSVLLSAIASQDVQAARQAMDRHLLDPERADQYLQELRRR